MISKTLSKRDLNRLVEPADTTLFSKLFQIVKSSQRESSEAGLKVFFRLLQHNFIQYHSYL